MRSKEFKNWGKSGMRECGVCVLLAATTIGAIATWADDAVVDYPEDYRAWTHFKTAIIEADHPLADLFGGVHHIYGNALALE